MEKHILNIKELEKFMNTVSIPYAVSYGKGGYKTLKCTLRGSYEVWSGGGLLLETTKPTVAIEKYNELP